MGVKLTLRNKFILALLGSSLVGLMLLFINSLAFHDGNYYYLITNLILAWIPLLFSYLLIKVLHKYDWENWRAVILTIFWLVFLPNSFYMITDFIHIQDVQSSHAVYFAVTFCSVIFNALTVGFVSLYLVHQELKKYLNSIYSNCLIMAVLLICSLGVYMGRDLRWNSWDVITNPTGILLDFTQRLITPSDWPTIVGTTGALFIFLGSIYSLSRVTLKFMSSRESTDII